MVDDILNLLQMTVRVDPHNRPSQGLDTQFGVEAFRPIVSDVCETVARLEIQAVKPEGKILHIFIIALPGDRLPDAKFLLSYGHLVVTISKCVSP